MAACLYKLDELTQCHLLSLFNNHSSTKPWKTSSKSSCSGWEYAIFICSSVIPQTWKTSFSGTDVSTIGSISAKGSIGGSFSKPRRIEFSRTLSAYDDFTVWLCSMSFNCKDRRSTTRHVEVWLLRDAILHDSISLPSSSCLHTCSAYQFPNY